MKVLAGLFRWIFILCLPVLLITGSLALAFNTVSLYRYGFEKYHVSEVTGIAPAELDKAAQGLISYFNSGEAHINVVVIKDGRPFTLFNEREVVHLRDVKALVWLDYRALLGTLTYAVAYAGLVVLLRRSWRRLAGTAVTGSGILLALIVAGGIGAYFDFDQLFLRFHLMSFGNDFWQLDPARDYLIMLFPQGFWYDASIFCMEVAALAALVIGGGSLAYLRRSKDPA